MRITWQPGGTTHLIISNVDESTIEHFICTLNEGVLKLFFISQDESRQSPAVISACFSEQFQPEIGCVVKVRGIVIQQNIIAVIAGYSILVLRRKPDFGRSRYLLFEIAFFVLQLPSIPGMLQQRFSKANVCPNTKLSHHVLKLQQHFVDCSDSQLASCNRK